MKKIVFLFLLGYSSLFAQNKNGSFFPIQEATTGNWYFIDKEGNKTVDIKEKNLAEIHPVFSDRALAFDTLVKKWGYLDSKGKWAIKPSYDWGENFVDDYTVVANKCTENCNTGNRGLLSDNIAKAIDLDGKVYFVDHSQEEEPYKRLMLYKHVGKGVFVYNSGIGMADAKFYCNLKGEVISDKVYLYDSPDFHLFYSPEIKAYNCKDHYINEKGEKIKELSKYAYLDKFINGYCWANYYDEETEEYFSVLLDKNYNEVIRSSTEEYSMASQIENGTFTFTDNEGKDKLYDLKTKTISDAPEEVAWEEATIFYDKINYPNEEIIMIVEYENYQVKYLGFVNKDKKLILAENFN